MSRFVVVVLIILAGPTLAQRDGIQKGKIKSIDADKSSITLTVDGKDRTFTVTDDTRVFGAEGKRLKERLKTLKVGMEVFFKPKSKNSKTLVGIKPVGQRDTRTPPKVDTSKLKPLDELGSDKYQGHEGGFYPGGKNTRPEAHEKAGLALAKLIVPLDAEGKANDSGKIVLLSVGMSNTSQSSQGFARLLSGEKKLNPKLMFVNGAQGGMTAARIQDPDDEGTGERYWKTVDQRLKAAKVTPAQVQVVWIKQADAGPTTGFPKYAQTLQGELAKIVRVLARRFPNVKLCYLSSRTYGGYARTRLNPEPYAYESGFSVKWLIEQQLKGEASLSFDAKKGFKAPWLSWGPYLWANGTTKRKDGFSYQASDFSRDGTHQSAAGQKKVGGEMFRFFSTDSTAKVWFLKP